MDIHRKSVDMDMDMDVKFHIHGNPALLAHSRYDELMVTLCVFHRNNKHVC